MFETVGNPAFIAKDACLNCTLPICDEDRRKPCRFLVPPRPVKITRTRVPSGRKRGRPRKHKPEPVRSNILEDLVAILQMLSRIRDGSQ